MRTYLTVKEDDEEYRIHDVLYAGTELNEAVLAYALELDPSQNTRSWHDYHVQVWENGEQIETIDKQQLNAMIVVNESKKRPRVSLRKPTAMEKRIIEMNNFYLGKMYEQLMAEPPLVGLQHFIKKDDEE